jgi:putative endonuclease
MREPPRAARSGPAQVGGRDPRHELGRLGEDLAATHLARLGCSILARNVRTHAGEIDLIAFDERQSALLFVEVKTRRVPAGARRVRPDQEPLQRLRARQRARLRRLACAWLSEPTRRRPSARTIRFDAIGVILDTRDRLLRLDHIEGAW